MDRPDRCKAGKLERMDRLRPSCAASAGPAAPPGVPLRARRPPGPDPGDGPLAMTAILGLSAYYHDSYLAAALLVDGPPRCRRAGGALHARVKQRRPVSPPRRRLLPRRGRAGAGGHRPCRLLRKALPQIRAAAGNTSGGGPRRAPLVPSRHAPLGYHDKLPPARPDGRGPLAHRYARRFVFLEHHESHAASAFFPSPFDEAAILTLDGVGE